MQVDILEHNKETGKIKIKFNHNNVIHVDNYDLLMVVPGTERELNGAPFTEEMQNAVINKLTNQIQREIEAGILVNKI